MVVEAVAGGVFWWMETMRCRKREKIRNKQNYETTTVKRSMSHDNGKTACIVNEIKNFQANIMKVSNIWRQFLIFVFGHVRSVA